MARVETVQYGAWDEFKRELFPNLYGNPRFRPNCFIFRGQARGDWALVSSFDRWYRTWGRGRERVSLARAFVEAFLTACEEQGQPFRGSAEDLESLALAQHYGVPTRLLDWTESPYIAAFFAFADHLALESDPVDTVAVWALDRRAPIWGPDSGIEVLRVPRFSNLRLRNQAGLFTLSLGQFEKVEEYISSYEWEGVALWRILLSSDQALEALSDLAAMGITAARLFPELEGAAAAARQRIMLES